MYGLDIDDIEVCGEHNTQFVVGEECDQCINNIRNREKKEYNND